MSVHKLTNSARHRTRVTAKTPTPVARQDHDLVVRTNEAFVCAVRDAAHALGYDDVTKLFGVPANIAREWVGMSPEQIRAIAAQKPLVAYIDEAAHKVVARRIHTLLAKED